MVVFYVIMIFFLRFLSPHTLHPNTQALYIGLRYCTYIRVYICTICAYCVCAFCVCGKKCVCKYAFFTQMHHNIAIIQRDCIEKLFRAIIGLKSKAGLTEKVFDYDIMKLSPRHLTMQKHYYYHENVVKANNSFWK